MPLTRARSSRARANWQILGNKAKKYAAEMSKQAAIDAAVGYGVGGKLGAVSGAVSGLFEGAKTASASFEKKNNTSRTMAGSSIRRRSKRTAGKRKVVVKKKTMKRKYIRKRRTNKKISGTTLAKKGITVQYEKRKTLVSTAAEAVVVGHTNMPSKFCAINMWRALLKFILLKAGVYIKDYSALMTAFEFKENDKITVLWFGTPQIETISKSEFIVTLTSTFDEVAFTFADRFGTDSLDDRAGDRLNAIQIVPVAGSNIPATIAEINTLKITVQTSSILKLQNVTQETAAADEAVDVTRVPLVGKEFITRGNNLVKKANSKLVSGAYATWNDDAIYGAWVKQNVTSANDIDYWGAGNTNDSAFKKPAEIPRKADFSNCISEKMTQMQPGEICVSKNVAYYTFGLNYYFKLLYTSGAAKKNTMNYESRLGKTKSFYLEKMVGRLSNTANEIKLWSELEVKQSVLVHGPYGQYTVPVQYQIDYDVAP